ncbi:MULTISPECIES: hypothetical protein [Natrialbaceae]|uniref:hypothetical protein n=1 Tax=Natrialbaceae TaxID=1644061 RepID=UPI00207C382E|nr:hypothetical protein [Natronococcus sp. CG52]
MTTDLDDDGAPTIRKGPTDDLVSSDDGLEAHLGRDSRYERDDTVARSNRNRNTALGFALVGAISFVAGLAVPDGRQVLFALAGIGGFAAVLTHSLAPGRVIEVRDAARVYETCAGNITRTAAEIGRTDDRRYVPDAGDGTVTIRLFVPTASGGDGSGATGSALEDGSGREGLFLEPTGASFVGELEQTLGGELADRPEPLVEQLTAALAERFELVGRVESLVDLEAGRVDIAVSDGAFGPVDQFDHPVASTLAVGLATGLERPVDVAVTPETDRGEWLVSCRWEREESASDAGDRSRRD